MRLTETIPNTPINAPKSVRRDRKRLLTSAKAGKSVPLMYFPLLREDRATGSARIRLEMMETPEMLMNGINVTCYAHFIPHLACSRFNGMDQFNRSYEGIPETEGGTPIPFFRTMPYDREAEIFQVMGLHAKTGATVNAAVVEAYNILQNHRRKARSSKLPLREELDTTLAPAFWHHNGMGHIVPDFDQAMIDGIVTANIAWPGGQAPLKNVWTMGATLDSARVINDSGKSDPAGALTSATNMAPLYAQGSGNGIGAFTVPTVDMTAFFNAAATEGVSFSLANIQMAKETAAWAKLRSQYSGISEDYLVDLLMQGIRVPEIALTQPILLDRKTTLVGYSRRYATDAANLDQSVTTGETIVDLRITTPPMNTGGIILITCEVVPEQLFERQKDYYLHATTRDDLPALDKDYLDPEKVAVVKNAHVDIDHDDPDATFGYAPLNHEWQRDLANVGGKYFRPLVDAGFDEDRQKLWAVETPNPTLTEDFYLATNFHQKVFADTLADAFEFQGRAEMTIIGNTVFGKGLQENSEDYEKLMARVDTSRITQDPPAE